MNPAIDTRFFSFGGSANAAIPLLGTSGAVNTQFDPYGDQVCISQTHKKD